MATYHRMQDLVEAVSSKFDLWWSDNGKQILAELISVTDYEVYDYELREYLRQAFIAGAGEMETMLLKNKEKGAHHEN